MKPDHKVTKCALLFSGVSTLGLIMAMALHELGHIIVILYYGGRMTDITLQPFSRSVVAYSVPVSASSLWINAGGIVFSMIIGLFILLAARKMRSPYGLPVLMTGIAAFIGNGFYLIFGSIMYGGFGDPAKLMALGVSAHFLVFLGTAFFLIGSLAFLFILPLMGISPEDTVGQRCIILAGGILPYLICVIIYNAVFDATRISHYFVFIAGAFSMLLFGACVTRFLSVCVRPFQSPPVTVCWKHAWFAVCLSTAAAMIELFSF